MIPDTKPHLHRYFAWLKTYQQTATPCDQLAIEPETELREGVGQGICRSGFNQVLQSIPEWELFSVVGRNLGDLLRGEKDALKLFFRDDTVSNFYTGSVLDTYYQSLAAFVDLLAFKCPSMNVLEIGAGTGSATSSILSKLRSNSNNGTVAPSFNEYWYTDVSPGFFEAATAKYGSYGGRMNYKVLNIEQDPVSQGFKTEHFDLIIASCVIHATANVENTLRNLEKLLKPEGRIAIIEPTEPHSLVTNFCFGLLPGWWLSEEKERRHGPLLTESLWDAKLRASGFRGIQMPVQHYIQRRKLGYSLMLSATKRLHSATLSQKSVMLILRSTSSY